MTDLIIHIGLPKAASTTIQDKVLKNKRGYLGKNKKLARNRDFGKQLKHLSPVGRQQSDKENKLQDWHRDVQEYIENKCSDIRRVILSHEGLCKRVTYDYMGERPIGYKCDQPRYYDKKMFNFLSRLSNEVWTTGKVKILLILRNQPEWLASLYVQRSKLFRGASQKDFERQIDKLIERGDDYIDWSKWLVELYQNFGQENVCVLLLENMHRQSFWNRFSEFMEIDMDESEKESIKDKYLNKRRGSENVWNIPSLRPIKFVKTNERFKKNKYLYHAALGLTRVVSTFIDITRFDCKRDAKIELHDDLRKRILEYCRPFNERLADQLKVDLKERGYLL